MVQKTSNYLTQNKLHIPMNILTIH